MYRFLILISEPDHLHRAHWHGNTLLSVLCQAVVSLQTSQYSSRCVYSTPFFSIYFLHVIVGVCVHVYFVDIVCNLDPMCHKVCFNV